MKMFTPFTYGRPDASEDMPQTPAAVAPAAGSDETLNQMKAQIEAMQQQIEKLIASKG